MISHPYELNFKNVLTRIQMLSQVTGTTQEAEILLDRFCKS